MVPALLHHIDRHVPVRYAAFGASLGLLAWGLASWALLGHSVLWALPGLALTAIGLSDLRQQRHSILRNYPVIGHQRFLLEFVRPEHLGGEALAAPL